MDPVSPPPQFYQIKSRIRDFIFESNSRKGELYNKEAKSSRGGLVVEQWCDNRLHSAPVDWILLGETIPDMSMFYVYIVPTPTDVCFKYK